MRKYVPCEPRLSGMRWEHECGRAGSGKTTMKSYICVICGFVYFVYGEAKGHPDSGLPPGTKWEDVPLNWHCLDCGAGKEDFEMIEI